MRGQRHSRPTPTSLGHGCCVFRCNLPLAPLEKWPGSFTCHCGNTGVKRTPNKSQHTKLTLDKKILPPLLSGFELPTFRSRVRRSDQQAIPQYVSECDCTREVYGHRKRVCTESWLWEKNSLPHRGIETVSAVWRSDALPVSYTTPCESMVQTRRLIRRCCLITGDSWELNTELRFRMTDFVTGWRDECVGCREDLICQQIHSR